MKKLKLLLFVLLIFPVFVSASNYDTEVNKANNLLNKERFVNTYEKYLIHGSNIKFEYNKSTGNKVNSAFSKGGFISMDEFNLTKKNGVTYLFEGVEFWTLTTSGDSVYAITYDNINTAKNKSSNYNGRATEFIIPTVTIHGEGKLNNPWYFDPVYKVTAKVDSKYATIEGDNPQYVKGNCTKSDCTAKIKIVEKSGYQYITNDCDGIYDSTTKILSVNNLKRDTVCNVSFGKGLYIVTLNQGTPNKIYLKNGENYYSDFETTTVIRKIESVEANPGYTFIGYFYNGNKIINGDKEPNPADDKKILFESVTGKYITKNVTLDPTWEANKYTITFDCNGGSNPPAAQTATYDYAFTLTSSVCQRAGYTQPKWNTKSDGTGEDYTVSVYTNYIWKKTSNVKLYAIWNECPAGTYSPANSNICTDCPVGSSCAKGSSEPTQCSAGTYTMTTGNATCSPCPAGTYNTGVGNSTCTRCAAGKYNTGTGNTTCTDCPVGTYNADIGKTACTPCAAGSYNTGTGNTTCTQCSKGSYNTETGNTSCTPCQASGAAGTGGTTSAAGQTSCNTSCNKSHVSTWETSSWNTNNTLTNNCKIKTCLTGYTLGSNTCSANTYTINYAGMDSATHGSSHPTTATYDTAFTVNNPSKSGYTFTGWNISGMDSVTHTYGSNTTTSTSISKTKETSFKNLRSTSGTVTFTATWTINQYTLTIKPSGGKYNNSTSDTVITQNYNTTYTVANPSAGPTYTISYNMNGTGVTAPTSPTSVQRPFSSWTNSGSGTLNGTTYTFGAGAGTLTATYNTTSNSFSLPSINKTGYACKWAEGSASGTQYAGGTSRTITANKTYYAICNINAYALTINPNGGTWGGKTTNSTVTQNYNTTYTVAAPTAGPTYTISYNMNGTGVTAPTSPTSVQRPFSSWTNSGSGSLSGTTYTFGAGAGTLTATYNGTSNSFNLPAISKTGYTCQWAKGSASGTKINGNTSTTITANTTFYAVCTINEYTLTVNPNGGTWSGSTSNQTFNQNYNTTKTIADPTATPTYKVTYNANSQGATIGSGPANVNRPFTSWTRSGSGEWNSSTKTYTYGPGNGTLTAAYSGTSASFKLPTCSKTGYTCQWAKGSTSGTKIDCNTNTTITGDTTFYMVCTIKSSSLVVNPNGGTWNSSTSSQTFNQNYNTTKTIADPSATPKYTISYNMNGTGITAPTTPTSVNRPFTGFTHTGSGSWNSSTKVFTFGDSTGTLTAGYNGTSDTFTLPGITLTGNSCKWAEGSTSGTQYAGGASRTITANKTYYAMCNANSYSISYKDEDGTTTLSGGTPTTYTYGVGATVNWKPTKTNKTFNGWSENTSLTGAAFTKTISATATGAKTYYAKWCQNCAAQSSNASCTLTATTAGTCTYTTSCPTGYTISNNGAYNPKCTANTFTVAYNANSGSGTTASHNCTYDGTCTLANNGFTRSSYTFNGWKKANTGTALAAGASIKNAATSGTVTYYAQWCQNCSPGTNATCTLNASTAGTCTYTTSCPTGYNISNNGQYNPTCTLKTFSLVIAANANVTAFSIKEGSTSGTSTSCTKSGNNFTCSNVKYGTNYYLYPTISSGYKFSSYEKTDSSSGSSLGSTSQVNTYYHVGNGNGNIKINVNQLTMQTATIDDCGTTMVDARNGTSYTTALLGDECWMTKNLSIPGGTTLTPALTNIASNYTIPASNCDDKYGSDPGGTHMCNDNWGKGAYYSWDIAVAGSAVLTTIDPTNGGSSSDYTFGVAPYDICPKGWKLPESFIEVYKAVCEGNGSNRECYPTGLPFYGELNGHPLYSGQDRIGDFGFLWSSSYTPRVYGCEVVNNTPACGFSGGIDSLYFRSISMMYTYQETSGHAKGIRCIMKLE